jgi:hypothetical protein
LVAWKTREARTRPPDDSALVRLRRDHPSHVRAFAWWARGFKTISLIDNRRQWAAAPHGRHFVLCRPLGPAVKVILPGKVRSEKH